MKNKTLLSIIIGVTSYILGIITGCIVPDKLSTVNVSLEPSSVSFCSNAKETSCFTYKGLESNFVLDRDAYEVVWDDDTCYARLKGKIYYEPFPDMNEYTNDTYIRNLEIANNAYPVIVCERDNDSYYPVACEQLCVVFFNNKWFEVPIRKVPNSLVCVISYDYAKKLELAD